MNTNRHHASKIALIITALMMLVVISVRLRAETGACRGANVTLPFTDVTGNAFFCQIAAAYFSGLIGGTTTTTYSPDSYITRAQMASFISPTLDQSLKRGSRRGALNQWALPGSVPTTGRTTVGNHPISVAADGADLWVTNLTSDTVSRVRGSDGKLLETWAGVPGAYAVLVARGRIFVTGYTDPAKLYVIDPSQLPSAMATTLVEDLGDIIPQGIAFAGYYIWTANNSSVSRIDPNTGAVNNYRTGFIRPIGMICDGANVWVTDAGDDSIKKLNSNGTVARSIRVGNFPGRPIFDGMNIWVPNHLTNTVTVVRARDAAGNPLSEPFVLTTLQGNGLNYPSSAAFDGERILVTNGSGNSVSLWKAADLEPLGFATGAAAPKHACSDGSNFWVALDGIPGKLVRF
jgi:hypothetical protein